ncbi:hypothetical protein Csa_022871, partial [Cucumis sativus]
MVDGIGSKIAGPEDVVFVELGIVVEGVVELGFEERTGGEGKEARKRSEEGELRWRKREEGRLRQRRRRENKSSKTKTSASQT